MSQTFLSKNFFGVFRTHTHKCIHICIYIYIGTHRTHFLSLLNREKWLKEKNVNENLRNKVENQILNGPKWRKQYDSRCIANRSGLITRAHSINLPNHQICPKHYQSALCHHKFAPLKTPSMIADKLHREFFHFFYCFFSRFQSTRTPTYRYATILPSD